MFEKIGRKKRFDRILDSFSFLAILGIERILTSIPIRKRMGSKFGSLVLASVKSFCLEDYLKEETKIKLRD